MSKKENEIDILGFDPKQLAVLKTTKNNYIYLAGKISKDVDWRGRIMQNYNRVCSISNDIYSFDYTKETVKAYMQEKAVEKIPGIEAYITGPFFVSCDHGCFHGDCTHGLGLHKCGCPDGYGLVFKDYEVKEICLKQIERSDLVLAYIDSPDCYGTLHEIAYAQAIGKETIVVFANPQLRQDMWFCCADCIELTVEECKYPSVIEQKAGLDVAFYDFDICELLGRLAK